MKTTFLSFALVLCLSLPTQAQEAKHEFGRLSQWEVDLDTYEKDPDAQAVVLFDIGDSYFFEAEVGYDIRFTRICRVKILGEAGLDEAEISIPYYVDGYGKTETIASIEAFTYNFEGNKLLKTEVTKDAIYQEQLSENWRAKKFVFPDVQVGSIIEYRVVLETPFLFNMPNWQFQNFIPTVYSEYTVRMIPFYEYVFYAQGISRFDISEQHLDPADRYWGSSSAGAYNGSKSGIKFNDLVYKYGLKDVPAFKDEDYITSVNDYIIKLKFQLAKINRTNGTKQEIISTWPKLKEDLLKHKDFGKYLKAAEKAGSSIISSQLNYTGLTTDERIKVISEYMKKNYTWNGNLGKYSTKTVKSFIKEKTGNAAEINLFLTGLLRAAGVDAQPIISSTRDHGKIKTDYPFMNLFNYVLVYAKDGEDQYLLDGTESMLAYNRIPIRCINDKGLIIDSEEETLTMNLYNTINSQSQISIGLKPEPGLDSLTVKAKVKLTEYEAYRFRKKYRDKDAELKSYFKKKGFDSINNLNTVNFDDHDTDYSIIIEGNGNLEKLDDMLVVKPFMRFPISENKLTQKKRTYPVDLVYIQSETITSVIEIPDNYSVIDIPDNTSLDNSLATIKTTYEIIGSKVRAESIFYLKKAVYNSNEYARIKHYFNTVIKDFNRDIVFQEQSGE